MNRKFPSLFVYAFRKALFFFPLGVCCAVPDAAVLVNFFFFLSLSLSLSFFLVAFPLVDEAYRVIDPFSLSSGPWVPRLLDVDSVREGRSFLFFWSINDSHTPCPERGERETVVYRTHILLTLEKSMSFVSVYVLRKLLHNGRASGCGGDTGAPQIEPS